MADISNKLQEADVSSQRYDYRVNPSALANTAIGEALTGIGKIGKAVVDTIDTSIQRSIQNDLFNERDKADAELGLLSDVASEASIDLPPGVTSNMNQMSNAKEAVAQGKMTETQFYNRMDSVVRQLRVKYPGYRSEIDKLAGEVLGFNTANAARKQMFANMDESAKAQAKAIDNDRKFLEDVAKAGVPMSTALVEASEYLNNNQPIPSELKGKINGVYLDTLSANQRIETATKALALEENNIKRGTSIVRGIENDYQTIANKNIVALSIPRGDIKTLDQLRESFLRNDGNIDQQEAAVLQSEIQKMKQIANDAVIEFYNNPIPDTNKTFGTYIDVKDRKFDGGLAAIEAIEKRIFGKDVSDVNLADVQIGIIQDGDALRIMNTNEMARKLSALQKLVPNALVTMGKQTRELADSVTNMSFTLHASDGKSAVQAIQDGTASDTPLSTTQITEGYLSLKDNVINFNQENPEEAYKQFKSLFGVTREGEHSLYVWAPQDRVKLYARIADPIFSKWVKENGTPQMKAEYAGWLTKAFVPAFRDDLQNVAALSAEDITGYQLTYDPGKGFKLSLESYTAGVAGNAMQMLAGNPLGIANWNANVERVNSFLTTLRGALPEGLSPEDEANLINTLIVRDLGINIEPSQAGGFWYKMYGAISNWISNKNSIEETNIDTGNSLNQNTNIQTKSETPVNQSNISNQEGKITLDTTANTVFKAPVNGEIIRPFNINSEVLDERNEGVNISVPVGTDVGAAEEGVVAYAGNELKGYGNLILISHTDGIVTAYAHLGEINVKKGDKVKAGDLIGISGQTGSVNKPQLHFEVRKGTEPLDPLEYINKVKEDKESSLITKNVQVQPASDVTIERMINNDFNIEASTNQNSNTVMYGNASFEPAPKDADFAIKTIYGEARGESPEGQQAIAEVIRNRSIATGQTFQQVVTAGDGSQFNAWKKSDPNYSKTTNFSSSNNLYGSIQKAYQAGMSSDITKGATHYYNFKTSNPPWKNLFVETARIGNHRFGYLKKDDPYRKKLMSKAEANQNG